MKNKLFLIAGTLFCASFIFSAITFAQDHTQWGLPEGAKARLGKGHIIDIAYSPDGTRLAVASSIGIWVYDAATGEALDLITGHTGWVASVSFSSDGTTFASGDEDGTVRLWDLETGRHIRTLEGHTDWVEGMSFSLDGTTLTSGSRSEICLWDVETGRQLRTLEGRRAWIMSVSLSLDGSVVARGIWMALSVYGCRDGTSHPHA